ncbi:Zn-dependent peptidases [Thiohalobacter thiocyanaticus]|uniref:Zn-dependent peptidases n=1 Tax=Thiohalobacter thiocyanaticus TaxID=585455 RepID=A0A1Z4VRP1_9GAMM|nr:hypothetical protein [Thiohalobacter thiocyanaticus]BAZ94299.1 Zn-dependent peptidases [Thiohalobacter thiocyanaticus]
MSLLNQNVKITPALAYASGTADRNGAVLDMQGFEGVMIVTHFATLATGAVTSIKAQSGTATGMGDAADLEDTGQSVAADDDDEIFVIDLFRPRERYVRLVVDKDGSNATAESATYIQYGAKYPPVSNATGVTLEEHQSPAEGTA